VSAGGVPFVCLGTFFFSLAKLECSKTYGVPLWASLNVFLRSHLVICMHFLFFLLWFALLICIWVVALVSEAFLEPFLTSVCPLVLIGDTLACAVIVDVARMFFKKKKRRRCPNVECGGVILLIS